MHRPAAYLRILRRKMLKERLPVEDVAAGWALGMFIGCAIPFGLQLVISVPLAMMMRVSKIGATLGTFITNPLTIFIIYPVQCWIGSRIIGAPLNWDYLNGDVLSHLSEVSLVSIDGWRILVKLGARVIGGFFVGGVTLALVMTPLTYFFVKYFVSRHRALLEERVSAAK